MNIASSSLFFFIFIFYSLFYHGFLSSNQTVIMLIAFHLQVLLLSYFTILILSYNIICFLDFLNNFHINAF